jgi:hypothetical protein
MNIPKVTVLDYEISPTQIDCPVRQSGEEFISSGRDLRLLVMLDLSRSREERLHRRGLHSALQDPEEGKEIRYS